MYNVYLTAWRAGVPVFQNLVAMAQLWRALPSLDKLNSDLIVGYYKGEGEQSIALYRVSGYELLRDIAHDFQQESILVVDSTTHEARLVYCDHRPDEHLGQFSRVDWRAALASDSWSYNGSEYFTTKSQETEDVPLQDDQVH